MLIRSYNCRPGSPAQIVCGMFIALVYIKLYGYFCPFEEDDDDVLEEMAQYQVFITLIISLLFRLGIYCTAFHHSRVFYLHY